jgi:hypothetical protein
VFIAALVLVPWRVISSLASSRERRKVTNTNLRAVHLPATVTSVGLLAQVPLTALLAVPLLGEPLTGPYLAGGVQVLAGIYVVNRAPTVGSRET